MAAARPESPADEFLRLACLYYDDDQPERWAQAKAILLAHPEITQVSVYAAAAAPDGPRLAAHLAGDPDAPRRRGGPVPSAPHPHPPSAPPSPPHPHPPPSTP